MSGKRMSDVIARFIEQAGTDNPKFYSNSHLQGIYQGHLGRNDTIFSYGTHFPLAEIIPSGSTARGWWLLNGDRWGGSGGWGRSTSSQQFEVRKLAEASGLPVLILPFSALAEAGISHDSIQVVDELPDRHTWEPRVRDKEPSEWERGESASAIDYSRNWRQLDDGRWSYEARVHHLGESLFTAEYSYTARTGGYHDFETHNWVPGTSEPHRGTGYFLSAFDENEPGFGLYFLAQMPDGAYPQTVAEAREAMKPAAVRFAENDGLEVLRQGDVFAVKTRIATKELPGPSKRSEPVLGVNHEVTEVRVDGTGSTFGRGIMRHRPREWGRSPEHRNLKLGDGKTWYELVRNTVPEGRSWSISNGGRASVD